MKCRHCHSELGPAFLDLGFAPPSNAYLGVAQLQEPELYFPLKLRVCERCWLVQTEDYARADELFKSDYAYFSSVSRTWLDHAARYAEQMCGRLGLSAQSFVIEVASNDGYLLKNFVERGIPCLGIEPTDSTAAAAEAVGVPVLREFFGQRTAERLVREGRSADLIAGNNVYAHVPDINDFTLGLKTVLKPTGTITLEFPHFERLMEQVQFDTVYHEHFSYLSLTAVARIFEAAGLRVFDVERLPTHGGSLRVFGCHQDDARSTLPTVAAVLAGEAASGLREASTYLELQNKANKIKDDLLSFLIEQKRAGKVVGAYGAAAKGNTLLNYAGVRPDLLPFVCDAAPSKQGKLLPGSHIPIVAPAELIARKPDYVLILPWNISAEIISQQSAVRDWGAKFVVAVPELKIF
jgi:SAM-dependent methyltransferase